MPGLALGLELQYRLLAGDAARTPRLVLRASDRVGTALERLEAAGLPGAPVVGPRGGLRGSVSRGELATADPSRPVGELAAAHPVAVTAADGLERGARHPGRSGPRLGAGGGRRAARRDPLPARRDGRLRHALAGNVRQVRGFGAGGMLLEADLTAGSELVGKSAAEAAWPRDVMLVAIVRAGHLIVP